MIFDRWVCRLEMARRGVLLRTLLLPALLCSSIAAHRAPLPPTSIPVRVILVANDVRDSMNVVFLHSTSGWKKYHPNVNAMNYGRGSPIWRETMRCLHGRVSTDTLWITSWESPRGERAFAAAVTGECDARARIGSRWRSGIAIRSRAPFGRSTGRCSIPSPYW
jgi:hypothetical protein